MYFNAHVLVKENVHRMCSFNEWVLCNVIREKDAQLMELESVVEEYKFRDSALTEQVMMLKNILQSYSTQDQQQQSDRYVHTITPAAYLGEPAYLGDGDDRADGNGRSASPSFIPKVRHDNGDNDTAPSTGSNSTHLARRRKRHKHAQLQHQH